MKKILSLIVFLVFSGNVLFAQIAVALPSYNVTCNGACNGGIHAEAMGGTPPYTFNWDNSLPPFQDQAGLCPGTYTCFVMDANSLQGYSQVTITEPAPLIVTISSTDDNGTGNGTATANVSGGTPPYTYTWSNFAITQTITNLNTGNYNVTVTDANGCTNAGTVEVLLNTSITFNNDDFNCTLFPNPAKTEFSLNISTNKSEDVTVFVYNNIGDIILTKEIFLETGENIYTFDIENISQGFYFVKLQQTDKVSLLKFIKK